MNTFAEPERLEWQDLGHGQRRKVCAYNADEMLALVNFETGAVGADHTHPHTQISFVLSGEFTYHIEDEVFHMKAGDSVVISSTKVHGCTCDKAGTLVDVFTPMRKDFV